MIGWSSGSAVREVRQDAWRARWAEQQARSARRKRQTAHRRPPKFRTLPGWCRWCRRRVGFRYKKNGELHAVQPGWHEACLREYIAATDPGRAYALLVKRDGEACRDCGSAPPDATLEVDHKVPLWRVAHLGTRKRWPYYRPGNLRLRCTDCHKVKTAREAGERAALRRAEREEAA